MLGFIRKKDLPPLEVDIHSHLIPGIDDGVKTIHESVGILSRLADIGLKKVITTPHIASEFYPNSPEKIMVGLSEIQEAVAKEKLNIEVNAAAEYYVDNTFFKKLKNRESILTFGDKHVLFETPFLNKPPFFEDVIFELQAQGYQPVFAHPERYDYVLEDPEYLFRMKELGVLFQVTASSLMGYYSNNTKKLAEWMFQNKLLNFLGSDIHHVRHMEVYLKFRKSKIYRNILQSGILNNSL